ncbi:unnamed protein product, partial [Rotaria sp. Silwood1]
FKNVLETTIVTGQTTIPSVTGETGETSATTGITETGSSQSQGIGTGFTSVSTVEGSTSTYTVVTTGTGSTTQAVSGTTTMRCEEMQAVDEAVRSHSHKSFKLIFILSSFPLSLSSSSSSSSLMIIGFFLNMIECKILCFFIEAIEKKYKTHVAHIRL